MSLSQSSVSSVSRSDIRDTLVLSPPPADRTASVISMSEAMTGYPNARVSTTLSGMPSTGSMAQVARAPESVHSSGTGSASGSGKDKVPSTPPRRTYHVTNDSVSTIHSPPPAYKSYKTDAPLNGVDEEIFSPPPVSNTPPDADVLDISRPSLISTPPPGSSDSLTPSRGPPTLSAPRLSLDKDTLGDLSSWSESLFSSIPSSITASPPRTIVATTKVPSFPSNASADRSAGVGTSRMSTRSIPPQKPVPAQGLPPRKDSLRRPKAPAPPATDVPPLPPPTVKVPEPGPESEARPETESEPSFTPPNTANTLTPLWHEVMSMVRTSETLSIPSTPSTSTSATTTISAAGSSGAQFTPITPGSSTATKFPLIVETEGEELDAEPDHDEEQDNDDLRVDNIREKDNRDSGMSTVTVTPATIVRGAIARSARANVIASPVKTNDEKDARPVPVQGDDADSQSQGQTQTQVRSQSPDSSDSSESVSSMTMSMSTSGTTSTSADSRPQTLTVSDVQEWKAGGVLLKTTQPSPREATFRDSERGLLAPQLSLTITSDDDDDDFSSQSDLLNYKRPSIIIDNLTSSTMSFEERGLSPASTRSSVASPGTPAPRYPGWVSAVVAPLRPFIDDSTDPRDLYVDLQEIAEGESGSVYAARVKASSPADESLASYVAIKNVPILPSGSPKLEDLKRELELMKDVRHPHVLSMDALYVDLVEDSLWIRMDLMERSLADLVSLVGEGIVVEEGPIAQFASDVSFFDLSLFHPRIKIDFSLSGFASA